MTCSTCGARNPETARFCAMCGGPLATACPRCGAEGIPGARFCGSCAEPLSPSPAAVVGSGEEEEPAPTAERRRISVLFVDLADFTVLAESMDPEDVRRVQSRYFELARSIVARYGGTIEKFIGDAVMAVWGAPAAHEDDAERATRAAVALAYAVDRLGVVAPGIELRARAAVTTGEAAVTIGATGQGMVTGDLVNVAARLQTKAPLGGVLVDATTAARAAAAATFEPVSALTLKGRSGRLAAFRVEGEASGPVIRSRGAHAGEFVGREREFRELTDLLTGVMRDKRSRLVSVTGVAGIGKSRLTWELGNWVDALDEAVAWHEGWAPAYGEGIAFAPVAQMVRRRIRIPDGAPPELARRQLSTALGEFVPDEGERRWIEPRLATLLTLEGEAGFNRDELFAAWRRFFERVSDLSPVVLMFEDLQWADPSLIEFIVHLATWTRPRPIMILTLARPEFSDAHPAWGGDLASFTALRLERLPDAAMRTLLEQRAPGLDRDLVRQILAHAGGVPLYAVEVARMLQEGADSGAERRRSPRSRGITPGQVRVPDSLHGLIAARIDALPSGERRLLLAAAALGPRFHPEALLTVVGADVAATRERIDGLVRRELLTIDEELSSPGAGELAFVQDLVREVAYQTLSRAERRTLHLAAARFLESRGDAVAEALAGHLVEAHGLTADPREADRIGRRAVAALRHAALHATMLHVPERAQGLLERALRLSEGAEHRAPLLEAAADAARAAGRMEVAEQHLRELITIQTAGRRRRETARTRARLASVLLSAQRNEPALAELEGAMRSVRSWNRDAAGVELAAQLARARLLVGDDRAAMAWAERALEAAGRLELDVIAADLLVTRGTAQLSSGDEAAGIADLRDAIARAEGTGSLHTELRARNNLAWSLLGDDPRAAMETARAGFDLATTMGVGDAAVPLADIACTAAVETGDWDWAINTIDELTSRGVSDAYGIVLASTAAVIRAFRGDRRPLKPLDPHRPLPSDTDAQVLASVAHAEAWTSFVSGEFEGARRLADESIGGYVGNDPAYQRALATRAALWLGDQAGASQRLEQLEASARRGRAAHATSLTMRAGLAALEGTADATLAYRRAGEAWTALDLPLQHALCLLDEHRLSGGGPLTPDVTRLLDDLGAKGLRALAADPHRPEAFSRSGRPRQSARSRRPSAGTARPTGAGRRSRPARGRRPPGG